MAETVADTRRLITKPQNLNDAYGPPFVFSILRVAGHPLAQNERCLHMFLQDEIIDKSYTPSKIRHA
ncbi:Sorting nexin-3 [Sciurus carolinensis]|uniref:Sorting nexin-3 n=1 Tax=Sciurus carolinensis TaxID=30640 RepID=A0AA41MQA6_SCICA|nr:Sorting nexin-3 [Sciurus carolinensis]